MQSFQILMVEDFKPFRQFIRSKLQERPELQVAWAFDGPEAVRMAQQL